MDFNPRPREEGDENTYTNKGRPKHFNPRPREEGDQVLNASWGKIFISIHALVKRATLEMSTPPAQFAISIHALVKRATFV